LFVGTDHVELMLFPEYSTLVSAERNLEEYPLFELKARQRGSKARLFERVIQGEGGVSLRQSWKVIPSGEYGMPGPVDQDVYLAVLQLLEKRGGMPEDGELAFSLYELRKVLGWSDDSGGAYREIKDALVRIQLTGVQSSNAFYSAADEQLIADSFNVWSVHFAQRRKRSQANTSGTRTTQDRHVLRFHPVFIRNYEAQYLKGLDADFFWSLKMPLSKRLYRLIDLQRAGGLSWRSDLFAVRDQIPLDYPYPSQIKRALKKAHAELEEKGFLSGVEYEEHEEENTTSVIYRISHLFARRQKALELSGTPQEMFAIERLMREGVRGDTARDLVVSHGAQRCLRYAEALDAQEGIRNRASFLVSAIRKSYVLPEPPEPDQEPLEPSDPSLESSSGPSLLAHASRETEPLLSEDPEGCSPPTPDPAAEKLWGRVLENARGEIDASSLRVWFGTVTAVGLGPQSLTISVPTPFAREYIETRFRTALEAALHEELSEGASLRVLVHTEEADKEDRKWT
jgi:Replication initiator protein A/DnaA N-terminal domain